MEKTIKLTLIKSLIIANVKSETFLRGQVAKAADQKLISEAYHEQAGDEQYQEALLKRGLYTNLEELKTHFADYLSPEGQSSADNIIQTIDEDDSITLFLSVGARFNTGFTTSLARLSSKYIEEGMLMDWWKPLNEKQAALYQQFLERDLAAIKRCFAKTAPVAPAYQYPTELSLPGSAIELETGETATITYSINSGAVDDIEIRVNDASICTTSRNRDGFTVTGSLTGHTVADIYSRHDPALHQLLHIYVTDLS